MESPVQRRRGFEAERRQRQEDNEAVADFSFREKVMSPTRFGQGERTVCFTEDQIGAIPKLGEFAFDETKTWRLVGELASSGQEEFHSVTIAVETPRMVKAALYDRGSGRFLSRVVAGSVFTVDAGQVEGLEVMLLEKDGGGVLGLLSFEELGERVVPLAQGGELRAFCSHTNAVPTLQLRASEFLTVPESTLFGFVEDLVFRQAVTSPSLEIDIGVERSSGEAVEGCAIDITEGRPVQFGVRAGAGDRVTEATFRLFQGSGPSRKLVATAKCQPDEAGCAVVSLAKRRRAVAEFRVEFVNYAFDQASEQLNPLHIHLASQAAVAQPVRNSEALFRLLSLIPTHPQPFVDSLKVTSQQAQSIAQGFFRIAGSGKTLNEGALCLIRRGLEQVDRCQLISNPQFLESAFDGLCALRLHDMDQALELFCAITTNGDVFNQSDLKDFAVRVLSLKEIQPRIPEFVCRGCVMRVFYSKESSGDGRLSELLCRQWSPEQMAFVNAALLDLAAFGVEWQFEAGCLDGLWELAPSLGTGESLVTLVTLLRMDLLIEHVRSSEEMQERLIAAAEKQIGAGSVVFVMRVVNLCARRLSEARIEEMVRWGAKKKRLEKCVIGLCTVWTEDFAAKLGECSSLCFFLFRTFFAECHRSSGALILTIRAIDKLLETGEAANFVFGELVVHPQRARVLDRLENAGIVVGFCGDCSNSLIHFALEEARSMPFEELNHKQLSKTEGRLAEVWRGLYGVGQVAFLSELGRFYERRNAEKAWVCRFLSVVKCGILHEGLSGVLGELFPELRCVSETRVITAESYRRLVGQFDGSAVEPFLKATVDHTRERSEKTRRTVFRLGREVDVKGMLEWVLSGEKQEQDLEESCHMEWETIRSKMEAFENTQFDRKKIEELEFFLSPHLEVTVCDQVNEHRRQHSGEEVLEVCRQFYEQTLGKLAQFTNGTREALFRLCAFYDGVTGMTAASN